MSNRPSHLAPQDDQASRNQTEEELLARCDDYYYSLAQSVPSSMWSTDPNGVVEYVNTYFHQTFGAVLGRSVLGTKLWSWADLEHPDEAGRPLSEAVREGIMKGLTFEIHARLRTVDSNGQMVYAPFVIRGTPVQRRDRSVYRWVGSATRTDLPTGAELAPSEADQYIMGQTPEQKLAGVAFSADRMAKRLEFLAEASAQLNSSLDIHTVLQNLARLTVPRLADWIGVLELLPGQTLINVAHFHRDPGLFHLGLSVAIKYPPPDEAEFGSYRVLKTGQAQVIDMTNEETVVKIGRTPEIIKVFHDMGVASTIVAPMIARGRIIGTISYTSATSGRHYDESDLEFAQEVANRLALAMDHANAFNEVQKLNRAKDDFLATLSHEMRTPLNVIMGYSELLRSGWHAMSLGEIQSSLETIYRNSQAQLHIVDDLLNVSSMVLGKVRLSLSRFSISELVQQCVDSLLVMVKAKDLKVSLDFNDAPPVVTSDQSRVRQIVMNLLTNAIKYTPAGGRIDVFVGAKGSNYTINVKDTGEGIASEFLPYVFDRFSQENSSITRSHSGLGLGLAVVRSLVELHGGLVRVDSEGRDRGSKFTVTLPIGEALDTERTAEASDLATSTVESGQLKGMRVLLVEDDRDTRALVRRYLEWAGAHVLEARNAIEGMQLFHHARPHLIVSDIGMPGEDGITFIKKIRLAERDQNELTPAAALTAFTRPEDSERALSAGFQTYITKPATRAEVLLRLTELLRNQRNPGTGLA